MNRLAWRGCLAYLCTVWEHSYPIKDFGQISWDLQGIPLPHFILKLQITDFSVLHISKFISVAYFFIAFSSGLYAMNIASGIKICWNNWFSIMGFEKNLLRDCLTRLRWAKCGMDRRSITKRWTSDKTVISFLVFKFEFSFPQRYRRQVVPFCMLIGQTPCKCGGHLQPSGKICYSVSKGY